MAESQKQKSGKYQGNLTQYGILQRFRVLMRIVGLVAFLAGVAIVIFFRKTDPPLRVFYNPGAISQAHAQIAADCRQCHTTEINGVSKTAELQAALDQSCLRCHQQHTFHAATTVTTMYCTVCHREHLGSGPMPPVQNTDCLACHANADLMEASARKGAGLPPAILQVIHANRLVYFQEPRPPRGFTQVIHSFDTDHPDFAIQAARLADPDTLKFNHAKHFAETIPLVNGKKLDCAYCHQPDARGAYMLPVTYEKSCRACHSLQIDPALPGFEVPHPEGNSDTARNFLLTLPTQLADYAVEKKGLKQTSEIDAFVRDQLAPLRERARRGDDLIRDVYYSDSRHLARGNSDRGQPDRALFPGCAYCHEVKQAPDGFPVVTKPVIPDRWYVHARFNHAAHQTMSCEKCHAQAPSSTLTSDILLPDKASCVACHSAKGGVVSTCVTCHGYHHPAPAEAPKNN